MKMIDARAWDPSVQLELRRAAAEGGALIVLPGNQKVVVVDERLWTLLQERSPSLSEAIRKLNDGLD